jgi:hypothetical protein
MHQLITVFFGEERLPIAASTLTVINRHSGHTLASDAAVTAAAAATAVRTAYH